MRAEVPIHMLTGEYRVIDPWFGRERCPIELDMGCGKGGFAVQLARRCPERLVLASDVMLGRLRKLSRRAVRAEVDNLELLRANSLELVGYHLPDHCIARLHLLCPDPWPKTRHHVRRLVTSDFLTRVARVLEPGGVFHFATDDVAYVEFVRTTVARLPLFGPDPERSGLAELLDLKTDFEKRWEAAGRTVQHLSYTARPQ